MAIFELPSKTFPSKEKARNLFTDLKKHYYALGPKVVISDPVHKNLILELLEWYYPEYKELCGSGIKEVFVDEADKRGHKSICFYIRRTDGTEENFGLKYIFEGGITEDQKFYRACNDSVLKTKEQIKIDKIQAGETCYKTNLPITKMEHAFLRHHKPTFTELVVGFRDKHQISTISQDMFIDSKQTGSAFVFSSEDMTASFIKYYIETAKPVLEYR